MDLSDPQSGELLRTSRDQIATIRAAELNVSKADYLDWLNGKPSPKIDTAMIQETDDKRRLASVSR